jgi:hypothetical protein
VAGYARDLRENFRPPNPGRKVYALVADDEAALNVGFVRIGKSAAVSRQMESR